MLRTEYLKDGALIRHYSDSGMLLLQLETGITYEEAIDVVPCPYSYEEINEPFETPDES